MDYIVYVKTNNSGYITAVNSSAFLSDISGWTEIGKGTSDKYHHAQGNYLSGPLMTMGGAYRYKLVNGKPVECTSEEIQEQEAANQPSPSKSLDERVTALEETLPKIAQAATQLEELDASYREGVNSI